MPELPEVETIRRVLEKKITGRTIVRAELRVPKLAASRNHQNDDSGDWGREPPTRIGREAGALATAPGKPAVSLEASALIRDLAPMARRLTQALRGRKIVRVRRRAKYLALDLGSDRLIVHLGMTGQLFAAPAGQAPQNGLPALPDKHTHLILELSGGLHLYYRDIRKFGRLRLLAATDEEFFFVKVGPEPLGKNFTPEVLTAGLKGKKATVKALLLNQRVVAGLGNIYVDEALFRARIAPQTLGNRITGAQVKRLHSAIREVLAEAIHFRGTSMSDYFDPESRRGGFQNHLRVYGRKGEPCVVCGQPIAKAVVAQRGTHWCLKCQKKGAG